MVAIGHVLRQLEYELQPETHHMSFHAGLVASVPDAPGSLPNPDEKLQRAFRPGSVWSFWGSDNDGNPVRCIDTAPNLFLWNRYGGEGAGGSP